MKSHGYAHGDGVHAFARRKGAFNAPSGILFLGCSRVGFLHVGSMRFLVRGVPDGHAHADLTVNKSVTRVSAIRKQTCVPESQVPHYYWQ